ncbi:MAG: type II toxin-antitoxin system RelE/ParE family toxin [Oscillospiraceae bacterium]|jgi:mRNA-degrading endonuclease RelE of RelBE toxin-antitoxin system|nr:type II toxin-antitoxin system RelE/ParE family toxin [Oscillospiraceae bacterium]
MEYREYVVLVDPSADKRLAIHIEYLARINENAAIRLYSDYEDALEFLKSNPNACSQYLPKKSIDAKLKYKLFGKRYRIVFEIIENAVYVYDIQDCRQDINKNIV